MVDQVAIYKTDQRAAEQLRAAPASGQNGTSILNPSRTLQVHHSSHSVMLLLLNLLTGSCGRTQSGEDTGSFIPSSGICHNFICKNQAQQSSDFSTWPVPLSRDGHYREVKIKVMYLEHLLGNIKVAVVETWLHV